MITGHVISDIRIKKILLSTGEYSIGIIVLLNCGIRTFESSPIGTTVSKMDPIEFFFDEAAEFLIRIRCELIGCSCLEQEKIDHVVFALLGENDFGIIGANLAVSISCAVLRSGAEYSRRTIYKYLADIYNTEPKVPNIMCNLIGGGGHHENEIRTTEMMIVGKMQKVQKNIDCVLRVRKNIQNLFRQYAVEFYEGMEGCLVPHGLNDFEAIEIIKKSSLNVLNDGMVRIGLDAAGKFDMDFLDSLVGKYPELKYIEDPFHYDDLGKYEFFLNKFHSIDYLAGDDITGGRICDVQEFLSKNIVNTIVLKLNHWGTISRLFEAVKLIKKTSGTVVLSQRSQETGSNIMAHIAVAINADYLKFGSPVRERINVYSTLIFIEDTLGYD